jgi:hypothetical protein
MLQKLQEITAGRRGRRYGGDEPTTVNILSSLPPRTGHRLFSPAFPVREVPRAAGSCMEYSYSTPYMFRTVRTLDNPHLR